MQILIAAALAGVLADGTEPGGGQGGDPLAALVGQRIRLELAGKPSQGSAERRTIRGSLASYDGEKLVLDRGDGREELSRGEVVRVEVSRGRRSQYREGAMVGGTVGGLLGLAWGALCYTTCFDGDGTGGTGLLLAPLALGAIGAAGGAILGAPFTGERWQEVKAARRPRLTLIPARGRGVQLMVSVPLGGRRGN